MTAFTPPFAQSGERRPPTPDEKQGGFACGEASLALFNFLMWLPQANIKHLADQAGEVADGESDITLLFRSIEARIAAATGAGDTSTFLLMSQARARLPIFPEVLNTDGRIGVTSPGTGTIRIPGGVEFLHRGIFPVTTVQEDIPTDSSRTYHLRWSPTGGFTLNDLASSGYNPSALAETAAAFDSTYDSMLVARVVTNASNVPTITNLANRDRFALSGETALTANQPYQDDRRPSQITGGDVLTLNWARRPRAAMSAMTDVDTIAGASQEFNIGIVVDSRYRARTFYQYSSAETRAAAFSYEVWA